MNRLYHSRRILKKLSNLFILLVVASAVFGINSFLSENQLKNTLASTYTATDVIKATNNERTKRGLPELKQNQLLMNASRNKANDMATNNYFAHISPINGRKWSSFIREAGYDYIEAGENLANGFDNLDELVKAWMDSPTHRENILNTGVDETGLAVREGVLDGYETIFVVQTFGKRNMNKVQNAQKPEEIAPNQPAVDSGQLKSSEIKEKTIAKERRLKEFMTISYKLQVVKKPVFD
jgi:uncharacterized protein YkwD